MQNVYHDDFPLYDETIKRQTAGGGGERSLGDEATVRTVWGSNHY